SHRGLSGPPSPLTSVHPEPRESNLDPTEPSVELPPPSGDKAAPGEVRPVENAPTFTPYTVQPDVTNREEVVAAFEREYPPLLRDAGIGGQVLVWLFIDETGTVQRLQVAESSGHEALDDAALRVAGVAEFTPAENEGSPVPVWISLPFTFRVRGAAGPEDPQSFRESAETPEATEPPADMASAPTFTPYTVQPDIKNREEIQRALEGEYPPLLRDAGIGGQVLVWFLIDRDGKTRRVLLNQTSGHEALDEAALRVAEVIEFTPALNQDERVPVWISLPITFRTR
ncbi:energy transducer TonB, partial [Gemmatimonadota bacterium]